MLHHYWLQVNIETLFDFDSKLVWKFGFYCFCCEKDLIFLVVGGFGKQDMNEFNAL